MVYRLDSIKANLVDDYLHFDEGAMPDGMVSSHNIVDNKVWLLSYMAGDGSKNPLPYHSTSDSFKIGKVMTEYGYDWTDLEREFLDMSL